MQRIDLHTHILPPSWPSLKEKFGYGGWVALERAKNAPAHSGNAGCNAGCGCKAMMIVDGKAFREIEANCWDPAVRIEEMDRLMGPGSMQVLSTVPVMFSYWARPRDGYEVSRMLNDHLAGVCADSRWGGRFAGLGTIPMQDPELACRELERCVNELGLRGVQIGSHVERPQTDIAGGDGKDWNLSEPSLLPVFQTAARLNAAVFVHPWDMMGQSQTGKYWLPWLVGMPAETSRAICSVLFSGLLEKAPGLRIGFAHGGGSFAGTIGRIEHGYHCRPDLCACDNPPPKSPRSYLLDDGSGVGRKKERGEHAAIYVDSLVHDPHALRSLLRLFGESRIALGSDYPFPLGEQTPGEMIMGMDDLDEATKARLLSGTAREFLGL